MTCAIDVWRVRAQCSAYKPNAAMSVIAAGFQAKDAVMSKGQSRSNKEAKKPKKEVTKTPYVSNSGANKPIVTQEKPKGKK